MIEILKTIRSADPDRGEREPRESDYVRFRQWVISSFGIGAWVAYYGNWDTATV